MDRLCNAPPANFLCDTTKPHITLIDCDSWQFRSGNQIFRCPVSVPDMLAPELLDQSLSQVTRSIESERFSLACLLFRALMLGRSPFDAVGSTDPVANIRRGYFPYGLGGGGIPPGKWFNIWSHLSFKLKEQMVKILTGLSQKWRAILSAVACYYQRWSTYRRMARGRRTCAFTLGRAQTRQPSGGGKWCQSANFGPVFQ